MSCSDEVGVSVAVAFEFVLEFDTAKKKRVRTERKLVLLAGSWLVMMVGFVTME